MDKFINVDFRIVISYDRKKGEARKRHLVGRRGLIEVVGVGAYPKIILRAYGAKSEKIEMRVRNKCSIIFYRK